MSRIIIVGEAYGKDEAAARAPFVGATGRELNALLEESGILPPATAKPLNDALWRNNISYRDEVYRAAGIFPTNVFNLQPPGNRIEDLCGPRWGNLPAIRPGKYIRPEFAPELERLKLELEQESPNLIIGLGATALWFLLGTTAISRRRGTISWSNWGKCITTFHPAYLMRGAWKHRPVVLLDLIKAQRESGFAEVHRPERFVYIPESLSDFGFALRELSASPRLSIDIETAGDQITCIGFGWTTKHSFVVPIFHGGRSDRSYWRADEEPLVWNFIRQICQMPMPKVFQNGLYDLNFLWAKYGIAVTNPKEDTMLLHHALQPEVQKGLGFLGSLYCDEPAWKLMRARGKDTTLKDLKEE